uniref:Triple gene block protein 1 n=1 Tax=papaya mottle-associated virus TaxID=3071214 RepID=A0A6G7S7H6_9VIRU|nr:Triple gene block protein 1 [papaya mottle-associated virus]
MNVLIDKLSELGYSRTDLPLRDLIVVNCVPGAGKTSLIRELVRQNQIIEAFTTGPGEEPDISGTAIRKWEGVTDQSRFTILDEYQNLEEVPKGVQALFGDPSQCNKGLALRPHWFKRESHRFGKNTAELLRKIGYSLESEREDEVQIGDIFKVEPEGQIICCESEVEELLVKHNADFLKLCEVIGKTFDKVTFITSCRFEEAVKANHYVCLSRHKTKLLILCPGGMYC